MWILRSDHFKISKWIAKKNLNFSILINFPLENFMQNMINPTNNYCHQLLMKILMFLFSTGYKKFKFLALVKNQSLQESNHELQLFWYAF